MDKINDWHKTTSGHLSFATIEVGLTYLFFSLAIDRGNLFFYLLTIIFAIGTVSNIFKLINKIYHGNR